MKHLRTLIICISILLLLTGLTLYFNRFVLPNQIKKIAITQAEAFLKRKVEIGTLNFSWVKGFVVNKIKIYQKESDTLVFAQVERINFGIVWIPGLKKQTINIPFINIDNPSLHLIKQDANTWNFSDLITPPASSENNQDLPVAVSVAGVTINNGQIRIEDFSNAKPFAENIDAINAKIHLGFKGIEFDTSLTLPQKEGFISAKGSFQPISKKLDADIVIKNIKPNDYIGFLPPIENLSLNDGLLKDINASVIYSPEKTNVKGSILINTIDVAYTPYRVQGNIDLKDIDLTIEQNSTSFKGKINLPNLSINAPQGFISSQVNANIENFIFQPQSTTLNGTTQFNNLIVRLTDNKTIQASSLNATIKQANITKDNIVIDTGLTANGLNVKLADNQIIKTDLNIDHIILRQDKEGMQITGGININNLDALFNGQKIAGALTFKPMTIQIAPQGTITASGDMNSTGLNVHLTDKQSLQTVLSIQNLSTTYSPSGDIEFAAKINTNKTQINWDGINANADINLANAAFSLKEKVMTYQASVDIANASVSGVPYGPFNNIILKADIATDTVTIKELNVSVLDTPLIASGSIQSFTNPIANIKASVNQLNLAKLKDIIPEIFKTYGLSLDGLTSVNIDFNGPVMDPLKAKITAAVELNNVSVASSTFNQSASNISGRLNATPDSLDWSGFTGTYLEKQYTLNGGLTDFQNPKLKTSLDGQDVKLNVDINKQGPLVTINQLTGKYLDISFNVNGTANMPEGSAPSVNIITNADFDIEKILPLLPGDQQKQLKDLKLMGRININSTVNGPIQDWQKCTIDATIKSPLISVMDYKINNLAIVINQRDQKINNLTLDATLYLGKVHGIGSAQLYPDRMPFDFALDIDGLDVNKIRQDAKIANEIRGFFFLKLITNGDLLKPLDVSGKGSMAIRDAYLADIEIMRGLLSPLRAVISSSNLIVNEVTGNFDIIKQQVTTDNLVMHGNILNLVAKGYVGFDQNIDMTIDAPDDYNQNSIIPEQIRRTISYIIKGKLPDVKPKANFSKVEMIKEVGKQLIEKGILKNIGGILEGI